MFQKLVEENARLWAEKQMTGFGGQHPANAPGGPGYGPCQPMSSMMALTDAGQPSSERYGITVGEDEDYGASSSWWRPAEGFDASSISSTSSRRTIPCGTGGEDELVGVSSMVLRRRSRASRQLCQVSSILVESKGMVWDIKLEGSWWAWTRST